MRRFVLPSLGATVLLAGSLALVSSAAYASTSATAPQTLAVQPGTLFVSNTTPASITAPVDGSGSGTLPTALWGDTTGTGDGWQGSVAASNFIYTGQWTPTGSAPALGSSSSASYTGSADGDTYTVSVTGVSGSTISFSYSSQNGATGTGTATAGTAANVGTNGLTITFSSSTTYSTGDEYQIQVGSQNKNALTLADGGSPASVAPYQGTTSTAPTFVNQTAAVTGGGSTYGTAVSILSAPTDTGMGEYTVTPAATVNTDINSWAATYTGQIQYTIASGPSTYAPAASTSGSTTSGSTTSGSTTSGSTTSGSTTSGSTTSGSTTSGSTTSGSYTPSGAPNIPIFVGDTTTLEPGWTTVNGGYPYAAGSYGSLASDGGWTNGDATFSFTVGSGESTTITYGIPAGGFANNSDATITVNGTTVATITNDTASGGTTTSTLENLWTQTFGPGTYTIGLSGGSINVYGLWASNLSAVTPS